ncbi:hypothetical protein J0H58_08620 [bacterium]|nr:hypothetical protein [bacterium]
MPDDVPDDENQPSDTTEESPADLAAKKAALAAGGKKTGSTDPADYPEKPDEDVSGPK